MDFNDVFGGPPRRYSNQEVNMRYSFTEIESEEGGSSLPGDSRWSGFDEKPVFGEEDIIRKQLSGNDFYDDIFRGDNSNSNSNSNSKSFHSPRISSTSFDLIRSNSGSRGLSPSRPLPFNAPELLSTSFPEQLSHPAKLTKAIDFPAISSAIRSKLKISKDGVISSGTNSPNASVLSRFSSKAKDFLDDNKTEISIINSETFLRHEVSHNEEFESSMAESSGAEKRNEVQKGSESSDHQYFHFSIYRWAGNGVTMLTPLIIGSRKWRSKKILERCSTSNGKTDDKEIMENFEEYIVSVDENNKERSSILVKTKSHDVPDNKQSIKNLKNEIDSKGKISTVQTHNDKETFFKALGDLLGEEKHHGDGIAMEEGVTTTSNRMSDIRSRQKNSKRLATNQGDASIKLRAEGKVKEFVKIFNHETSSPKTKILTSDSQSHSSRWKGIDIKGKENKTHKVADVEVNVHPNNQKMSDVSSEDSDSFNAIKVEQDMNSKSSNNKSSGFFADKKNDPNVSEPSHEAKVENIDEFFEGHFQVEEVSNIMEKDSQNTGNLSDIKALDAKIQQWSSGRKGNIRSLLSTLQYVLWADSGWKAIPLVDIIEGNAVNRAYKKAMLYLHPDKLQQKGATSHQKYTAEKVFEILQEAWDHFNTLGAI